MKMEDLLCLETIIDFVERVWRHRISPSYIIYEGEDGFIWEDCRTGEETLETETAEENAPVTRFFRDNFSLASKRHGYVFRWYVDAVWGGLYVSMGLGSCEDGGSTGYFRLAGYRAISSEEIVKVD